ncbi:hypothetical protein MASR1M66_01280 [Aminivibrio sp.]
MLSPLLNTRTLFSAGSAPEGTEQSSDPGDPGEFARLLSSCLKNFPAPGEPPSSGGGEKKSSSEWYSSLALLPLLTNIPPELFPEEGAEQGLNSPSPLNGLFPGEEAPPEEERERTADSPSPESALTPGEDGSEIEAPLLPEGGSPSRSRIHSRSHSCRSSPGYACGSPSVPAQERSSLFEKAVPDEKGVPSGKGLPAAVLSPAPQKEGANLPSGTHPLPEGAEGTREGQKNLRGGPVPSSPAAEEGAAPSLPAEKDSPGAKNQGQDTNRRTLDPPPADREGPKEPQPVRTRDGESPFTSFLRGAGPSEVKAPPPLSSGGEVPLSGRNGEALGEGMTNVVRFLRRDGLHKASIVVEPPALGRVEIELSATAGGVEASIRVGSEQLRQLVQDQLIVLRNSLSQQGVQMTSCTVDIGDSRMDQGKEKNEGEKERGRIPRQQQGEESLSFRVDLEQGLLYWMA